MDELKLRIYDSLPEKVSKTTQAFTVALGYVP